MWYNRKKSTWYGRMGTVCRNRWFQIGSTVAAVAGLLFRMRRRRAAQAAEGGLEL